MKLHRFFVGNLELGRNVTISDDRLIYQWNRILRFRLGREIALFNGDGDEWLFKLSGLTSKTADLEALSVRAARRPQRRSYLCFSILKKDKNELILQKATELGVTDFVPIHAERCERTDISQSRSDRWQKIIIEAAEQCGRVDIPAIAPAAELKKALADMAAVSDVYVAEELSAESRISNGEASSIFVGPEGGWSDTERKLFEQHENIKQLHLGEFTLRAETAAIVAAARVGVQYVSKH